jgi:hypothetical protein
MVTHTREVLYTAATDKNHTMLLQVMADTGDVSGYFNTVGKTYSGNFTKSRVRLLRGRSFNSCTNAALLGRILIGRLTLHRVITL